MDEDVDFDVVIDEMHDKTIKAINEHLACKIKVGVDDKRIIILVYKINKKKFLFFTLKDPVMIAKFSIAFMKKYSNVIVVEEEGIPYYDDFKKIGKDAGYDKLLRKWR